jgi:hypothetical protein
MHQQRAQPNIFLRIQIPFVPLAARLDESHLKYEIRTEFPPYLWARATADVLERFGWFDVCLAFAYDESRPEIVSAKNEFVDLWLSKANRTLDVAVSFDSAKSALAAADLCSQRGRRAMIIISDGPMAHLFISELWYVHRYITAINFFAHKKSFLVGKSDCMPLRLFGCLHLNHQSWRASMPRLRP